MLRERIGPGRVARTSLAVTVILGTLLMTACPLFSKAKGKVVEVKAENDMGLVDNQLDYGITVTAVVRNMSTRGEIRIMTRLNCDEGEWQRTQDLQFNTEETKTVKYFFSEPTVNVSNCQYSVSVWPE